MLVNAYMKVCQLSFLTHLSYPELSTSKAVWPQGYNTFFMLSSAEHEISIVN